METPFSLYFYYLSNMAVQTFNPSSNYMGNFTNPNFFCQTMNNSQEVKCENFFPTTDEHSKQTKNTFKPITIKTPEDSMENQNSTAQLKKVGKRKYIKKKKVDQNQYVPNQKSTEKKSNAAYLNQFRNILPNTIHQILSYVQRKNKSKIIIEKLVNSYQNIQDPLKLEDRSSNDFREPQITCARFYAFQNQLKNKLPNYVTMETFRFLCSDQNIDVDSDVFTQSQQRIYNKICRSAILYYLQYEVVCVLMSSKRMQKDKKRQHLKVNRKIESYIRAGFREEPL